MATEYTFTQIGYNILRVRKTRLDIVGATTKDIRLKLDIIEPATYGDAVIPEQQINFDTPEELAALRDFMNENFPLEGFPSKEKS